MALSRQSDLSLLQDRHFVASPERAHTKRNFPDGRLTLSRATWREGMADFMTRQFFRERECIHRDAGATGEFYNGVFYVQALQRLRVDEAVQVAAKVSSFFWADAPHILVWLCDECATELRLTDTPRAMHQARRQA